VFFTACLLCIFTIPHFKQEKADLLMSAFRQKKQAFSSGFEIQNQEKSVKMGAKKADIFMPAF
jgi:hypothetical protein